LFILKEHFKCLTGLEVFFNQGRFQLSVNNNYVDQATTIIMNTVI